MKIGLISDTHIPRRAIQLPSRIFEIFSGADYILHAGDLTNLSVLDELYSITPNVEAVSGNMDPPDVEEFLFQKKILNIAGYRIGLIHGWGPPVGIKKRILNQFGSPRPDIIVFGHTHSPEEDTVEGVLFLNPGSPTDKVFARVNSVGLLTLEPGKKPEYEIIYL